MPSGILGRLGILHSSCVLAAGARGALSSNLLLGLLVAVRNHSVQQGAWLALIVAVRFSLLDFSAQVGGCLFILALIVGVVLVEVLGWVGC